MGKVASELHGCKIQKEILRKRLQRPIRKQFPASIRKGENHTTGLPGKCLTRSGEGCEIRWRAAGS